MRGHPDRPISPGCGRQRYDSSREDEETQAHTEYVRLGPRLRAGHRWRAKTTTARKAADAAIALAAFGDGLRALVLPLPS
ncbi:hypothetical protein ACH4EC_38460 [Streptomyces anulatus]